MSPGTFASRLADRLDPYTHTWGGWRERARPEQLPPDGDWRVWYVRGGRGGGKTWTGSSVLAEEIVENPPGEWAVIAPTYGDARDTCIESPESGLIRALGGLVGPGGTLLEHGPHIAGWNRSMGDLRLRNGTVVYADGADDGALRIQGKNLRGAWCDEVGLWKRWQLAWDESIRFAVRKSPGRIIATGTPKRGMPAITLVRRLLDDDTVPKTLLLTEANAGNLHPAAMAELLKLAGTPLGRQELEGAVIDVVEGALWTYRLLDAHRVAEPPAREFWTTATVALDPSDGGEDSDEQALALVVAGWDRDLYVLGSEGMRVPVTEYLRRAVELAREYDAVIVAEKNHGGAFLTATLEQVMRGMGVTVPYRVVTAAEGKRTRAEPVAALYEQGKVHHVGAHPDLEEQLTSFTGLYGERSPDRLDALVWAVRHLTGLTYTTGATTGTYPGMPTGLEPDDVTWG